MWKRVFVWTVLAAMSRGAAAAPAPVDDLLAADRGFATAGASKDVVNALAPIFADDVVMPAPGAKLAEGKTAVLDVLRSNADNLTSRLEWTPVRVVVSADGTHGFTAGYMTLTAPSGTAPLKYLAYWIKKAEGWRVVAYKRVRGGSGEVSRAMLGSDTGSDTVSDPRAGSQKLTPAESLDAAERAFSNDAQTMGVGAAFVKYGRPDALNLAGGQAAIVVGSDNIGKLTGAGYPDKSATIAWAPDRVIVAPSGDLGVTIGWIRPHTPEAGQPAAFPFFTVWRRDGPNAPWRYIAE